ncbi:uncharacterized protein LOC120211612 [Hibiscus syriacus]|uniref:uncharacterized protein LOC120211612 n=1 Tax=Hibiscus syriacus TaxID=106335 RepID=UPI0019203EC3|nr:uncharacterized protein LOC120211612 [Hibiscus syriacus]
MDMFWQRSFSTSTASASYGECFYWDSFPGNKKRKFPKPSSYSGDTIEEDQLRFQLSWRSSKQSTGIPMKKLLAEEMSKENESRRRSPSVIARLMGLDGLPPKKPHHNQRKRTETSRPKVQKSGVFYSRRSSRKRSNDDQEFKDVSEVLDASKVETGGYSSQGTANSMLSDVEVPFIQQKFMEAKGLSKDEKSKGSEEFSDADSSTDIRLKFLRKPDSLFRKHLDDLQGATPQSRCGQISAMKSSHTLKNRNDCLGQQAGRETQLKHHSKCPQQHQEDYLSQSYGRYTAHSRLKVPKVPLAENNGPAIVPTTIVVLKPNLAQSHSTTRTTSSPCSSHHYPSGCAGNSVGFGIRNEEAELLGEKNVHQDIGFSRHNSRESRKIAREITRQMKNRFSNGSMKISTSRFRGYFADANSCDVSGSKSENDSDVTTWSYTDSIGWNKQHRWSSSLSSESSLIREAKKRLSERWKLTHRPHEIDLLSNGSTLGEMLAISENEVSPVSSSSGFCKEGCSEFRNHVRPAVWNDPLGISSRDGWKDGRVHTFSNFGSPRISTLDENCCRDKYVIRKDSSKWSKGKAAKGNLNQQEALLPNDQRFHVEKSQFPISSCSSNEENSDTSLDFHITAYRVQQNTEADTQSEHSLMVSGSSANTAMDSISVLTNAVDANDDDKVVLSEPSHYELSAPTSLNVVGSTGDLENLDSQVPSKQATLLHCPVSELESQVICKEADQPSPVSITEAPFTEDFSSGSECFESISADLHGLRMQLQLLKLESEAYQEGSMLLSSDDDGDEASVGFAEYQGIPRDEENWESMYMVDILVDSGINGVDPDTFLATWNSPECPVNPLIFEQLEKKYRILNPWSRAERRLMFDMINSKLLEMYQQYMDQHLHPSMKPARKIVWKWNTDELKEHLRKSLVMQNMELHTVAGKMVLAGEWQWLESREDIDVICREIEKLLVDELAAEVMAG